MSQSNIFNRVSYKKLDVSKIKLENLLDKDDKDDEKKKINSLDIVDTKTNNW